MDGSVFEQKQSQELNRQDNSEMLVSDNGVVVRNPNPSFGARWHMMHKVKLASLETYERGYLVKIHINRVIYGSVRFPTCRSQI